MKGFRLVQDFFCNERIYLKGKVLKNQRCDGNDSAELDLQEGLQLILVESWCPLRACWTDSLWEARETGIIAFLWKGSSYSSCRAGGNHAVLLTPTYLSCSCYRSLGFTEEHGEDAFTMSQPSPLLFQTLLGPLFVSHCGWYNCGHFLLAHIALWLFICQLMCKLQILGLIQNILALLESELWWGRIL